VQDVLFYLWPRNSLTAISFPGTALLGMSYGKEIRHRMTIEGFRAILFLRWSTKRMKLRNFHDHNPTG